MASSSETLYLKTLYTPLRIFSYSLTGSSVVNHINSLPLGDVASCLRVQFKCVAVFILMGQCYCLNANGLYLVQLMVWGRQTTIHYMSQYWPRLVSQYIWRQYTSISLYIDAIGVFFRTIFSSCKTAKMKIILQLISVAGKYKYRRDFVMNLPGNP